tara:strand:- start:4146 stop:4469 length:324 start_codon:yes stop_codon:yes gene_type:complete
MLKHLFMIIALCTIVGCSTSYHESTQISDEAYLALKGDLEGLTLIIDEQSIDLNDNDDIESYYVDGIQTTRFVLPQGQHQVKIYRHQNMIVHRKIFISSGHTFEVKI